MNATSASRLRPKRLHGLTLTNMPGNRGGRPISTIENRYPGTSKALATSPIEAVHEFTKLVNRKMRTEGLDFTRAWNGCRIEQPALFNSMAATNPPPGKLSEAAQPPAINFARIAGDALSALALQEQRALKCEFRDAWPRVCNRRRDLVKLSNRELPEGTWNVLEVQARKKFIDSFNLGPDGKILHISDPAKVHEYFRRSWDSFTHREPNLKPLEVWEKIKAEHPHILWPFVAVTAQ